MVAVASSTFPAREAFRRVWRREAYSGPRRDQSEVEEGGEVVEGVEEGEVAASRMREDEDGYLLLRLVVKLLLLVVVVMVVVAIWSLLRKAGGDEDDGGREGRTKQEGEESKKAWAGAVIKRLPMTTKARE
jgi:hypothetical protein